MKKKEDLFLFLFCSEPMLLGPGGWGVFFFSFFVRQIAFLGFFESKLVLGTWVLELHYLPGISDGSTIDTRRR